MYTLTYDCIERETEFWLQTNGLISSSMFVLTRICYQINYIKASNKKPAVFLIRYNKVHKKLFLLCCSYNYSNNRTIRFAITTKGNFHTKSNTRLPSHSHHFFVLIIILAIVARDSVWLLKWLRTQGAGGDAERGPAFANKQAICIPAFIYRLSATAVKGIQNHQTLSVIEKRTAKKRKIIQIKKQDRKIF